MTPPGTYDVWAFRAHPDVWVLMAGIALIWLYAIKRLGPRLRPEGQVLTRGQQISFWTGWSLMWLASDWPMHDLADASLFSMHMVQHLILSLVVPPLILLGTPTWLMRELLSAAGLTGFVARFGRAVPAAIAFNGFVVVSHWPAFVNLTVESGLFHFFAHAMLVGTALLMWMPVAGPLPELRLQPLTAMLYLFIQSIIPTIPAAWLTFADSTIYTAYDPLPKAWGVGVLDDQQAAGLIMKLVGGMYLWTWIAALFFRWSSGHDAEMAGSYKRRPLTTADVEAAFAETPAPEEPAH